MSLSSLRHEWPARGQCPGTRTTEEAVACGRWQRDVEDLLDIGETQLDLVCVLVEQPLP